jgi:hypothetical protein
MNILNQYMELIIFYLKIKYIFQIMEKYIISHKLDYLIMKIVQLI